MRMGVRRTLMAGASLNVAGNLTTAGGHESRSATLLRLIAYRRRRKKDLDSVRRPA